MIVACPSCRTRYRHSVDGGEAPKRAHCSRCDQRFPIVARRNYVVLPLNSNTDVGLGIDASLAAAEVAMPGTAGAAAIPSSAGRDGLLAFLFGSIGAFAGYQAALWQAGHMPTWTASGAGVGMVLGWAWVRWRSARH